MSYSPLLSVRKAMLTFTSVALAASLMTACSPGHNTTGATLVGAGAGGLIASQFFHGNGAAAGIIAGTIIGGIIGNQTGQYMDRQDRANMANAVTNVPVGQQARWTSNTGANYTVTPVKQYKRRGRYCREYNTTITIDGRAKRGYGTACRQPDGSWKIKS